MNEKGISDRWIQVMVLLNLSIGCNRVSSEPIAWKQNASPRDCIYYDFLMAYTVHFAQKKSR
jgi:hypothetical protein